MKQPRRNTAASVRQRLLNAAKASARPFNELLQHYAMERFLYRLSVSPHGPAFVLKGALLMRVWEAPAARPTLDIDLLGKADNEPNALAANIRQMCEQKVEDDGMNFDRTTVESHPIVEEADYPGVRVRFTGHLGTARVTMQIDIGFGDVVTPAPVEVQYPTLLDMPAPRLTAYPLETAIAEKFQVMLHRARLNSRLRDYYDIWLLSRAFTFNGELLAAAIQRTCAHRETVIGAAPPGLSAAFATDSARQTQWRTYRRKNELQHAPEVLAELVDACTRFLGPLAASLAAGERFTGSWEPPGPWQRT